MPVSAPDSLTLDEETVAAARDRFYPDWWMFADPHAPVGERPAYRVVCRTETERELAYLARPPHVDATIVLEPLEVPA